ncbi:MAG: transposase [Lachnoclostridium sp.]|nr:transposase [Lachnoclostridium sp.]
MSKQNQLVLESFYPQEYLKIKKITENHEMIMIQLKSITKSCECPKCHIVLNQYHGTYVRKVQDLPILGKPVYLEITVHEYQCSCEECVTSTIAETYDGFLNFYSCMTEQCADFICTLALETSCEGCARICKEMGIRISGDSVIRLLLKRYESQSFQKCGDTVGIDDFAFKKRNHYGTIIVDNETHKPVAILDGRDGESLRQWLKNNKHVKMITRDRASAYAKVLREELPDAMQIADRFHLHQNLLEAVKGALNRTIPATVKISHDKSDKQSTKESVPSKKNRNQCG